MRLVSAICISLLMCIVHGSKIQNLEGWWDDWDLRLAADELRMSSADGVVRLIKKLENDDAIRVMKFLPDEMPAEEKQTRLEVGQLYHLWRGHEYGVLAPGEISVTHEKDELPFIGLPATVFEAVNTLPDKEL